MKTELAWKNIISIQEEYFETILNSPIIRNTKIIKENNTTYFQIPQHYFTKSSSIIVPSKQGYQPSGISHLERIFENIFLFWQKNTELLNESLSTLSNQFIYVNQITSQSLIRKYSLFYKSILVTDQSAIYAFDYDKMGKLKDPQKFGEHVIKSLKGLELSRDLYLPNDGSKPFLILVPPLGKLNKNLFQLRNQATRRSVTDFLSQLADRQFDKFHEAIDYFRRKEVEMNIPQLNILLESNGSKSIREFSTNVRRLINDGRGVEPDFIKSEFDYFATFLFMRFSEYERMASDSFTWEQENEIVAEEDVSMYDWWYSNNIGPSAKIIGNFHSEDFVKKLSLETKAFEFLNQIEFNSLVKLLKTDPIEQLREDLELSKVKISVSDFKTNSALLNIENHLNEVFRKFENKLISQQNLVVASHKKRIKETVKSVNLFFRRP